MEATTPKHGTNKIFAATATLGAGAMIGTDLIIWIWSMIDKMLPAYLGPMPEVVAMQIVSILSVAAFYFTKETS